MSRTRTRLATFAALASFAALIVTLLPAVAEAGPRSHVEQARSAEVDFGECTELSTGTTAPLSELQKHVPANVPVLSLTQQGTVFPGSDDLGILITRTLKCDSISVTKNGHTTTQEDRHIAHVGTPVDTSVLPVTPFSNDGANGADFNNFIFAYYSDSGIYRTAMRRAGIANVAAAYISLHDNHVDHCLVERSVAVIPYARRQRNYGFEAFGTVPNARCELAEVPFIANWWGGKGPKVSVLSNNIVAQAAIFIDTEETVVTVTPTRRSRLRGVFGAPSATADAFGVIGLIPETPGTDMVIAQTGWIGGPLNNKEFTLQNYFASPNSDTGAMEFAPFFDAITEKVGPGQEVDGYLYDIDFSANEITMKWDTTPDAELPDTAVPNDIYPPFVGAISGLTQDQAAAAPIADEYWFDFDRDLTGINFTVDTDQTLVPNVRLEGNDTLVISIPGGTSIGDGFNARIVFTPERFMSGEK